ncbi:MAG: glutamate synthase subunit beta, partial [Lentisphaeria bacterium]|nr:glutamate synthase subunit beta [Lentisphaeria bacterium]
LAMGFTGVPKNGIIEELDLQLSPRNGILADPGKRIYAVGDCVTGASLVVRSMANARQTAEAICKQLI